MFENTDDGVKVFMLRDVHAFADGVFIWEESLGDVGCQDADGIAPKVLGIRNEVTVLYR